MSFNITILQGSTFTMTATVTDSAGDAVNLTGYDVRMQVRTDWADAGGTVLADLTIGDGITVTPATGVIVAVVDADITEVMPQGRQRYDMEIESAGGEVTRILEGVATVTPEVTRTVTP